MAGKILHLHVVAFVAVALLVLVGCSTTGVDRAEQRVASMEQMRAAVVEGKANVTATSAALQEVVAAGNADPRPAYAKYKGELTELDSAVTTIRGLADDLQANSKAYFDNWTAQLANIENPDIKARAEKAKQEFTAQFTKIKDAGQVVKTKFAPLSADLHDIQKYLDLNLNAQGVASIKDLAEKASKEAGEVNVATDALLQAVDAARAALAPFKGAEAAPAPAPEGGAQK